MVHSPAALAKLLEYDAESGRLFWKPRTPDQFVCGDWHTPQHRANNWNAKYAGTEAFLSTNREDYRKGSLKSGGVCQTYLAHRVAWAIVHGRWPIGILDHINRVRTDNRICNLREVSATASSCNCSVRSDSQTGVRGVGFVNREKKYHARIKVNGRKKHLGYFENLEDAIEARKAAESERDRIVFASH